ncbi:hypothetical protein [Providencia rettgeri]|uniref:hypothetical protein n=1 Tax=Providencia rettgeri TaxID=587 RepID=UPI001C075A03
MTQAHKQQYKYKVTGKSFKCVEVKSVNKKDGSLKYIVPVILFAAIYLISRI